MILEGKIYGPPWCPPRGTLCGPERAVTPLFGQSDQPEYVGVPDDHWGEQVAAFVRPAPGGVACADRGPD